MNDPARIGVFGGTFDPIHRTHLNIARAAMRHAKLDRVLFVVAGMPPHKHGEVFATPEQRLRMVEAALADEPGMEACDIELKRHGPSYTADTLDALRAEYPDAELHLILGLDSLADLPDWYAPDRILRQAKILGVSRPGIPTELPPLLVGHCDLIPFAENDLSSTEVRDRLACGEDVSHLLPPAVLRYIQAEGLYHARG